MTFNIWAAEVAKTRAEIKQTLANLARDEAALAQNPDNPTLQRQVESGRAYLADLELKLTTFLTAYNNVESQPVASSGDVVGNANQARDENANANRPITGQQILSPAKRIESPPLVSGTNATVTPTAENNPTTGTNNPLRPITQTQATTTNNNVNLTPAQLAAIQQNPGSGSAYAQTGGPGAAAPGDNNTPPTPSVVVNRLNTLYAAENNLITPRSNVLDSYYSYTYSLSWYLVEPIAYNETVYKIKKNINNYYLLAQSGGAGTGAGTPAPELGIGTGYDPEPTRNTENAQRSPYFNLDYYIDNLSIETAYSGTITSGGPMTYKNISFTISEPNGVTLPINLYRAVNDVYALAVRKGQATENSFVNYASGMYCMVIRFYGYNDKGELIQPITNNVGSTDPKAAVEKFIFYQQTSLNYSVSSKLTEYRITGASPSTRVGFSSDRGSIPFNAQFTGTTVKDVLQGQIKQQTASQAAGDATRNDVPVSSAPPSTSNANLDNTQIGAFDGIPAGGQ
jgi:hypothetical protein